MKGWKVLAAAVVLGIPAAVRAQESGPAAPPKEGAPAKHENKVTPAAQAAFDKMKKSLYTPVEGGLKDLSGAVKVEMESGSDGGDKPGEGGGAGGAGGEGRGGRMGMMGKIDLTFAVAFKAPDDLKVEWKDLPGGGGDEGSEKGGGMVARMREGISRRMSGGISRLLHMMLTGFAPAGDSEYDADVKVVDGVTKVEITSYLKGVEVSTSELTLDGNGLPSSWNSTSKAPEGAPPGGGRGPGMRGGGGGRGADGKSTINFSYSKEGDLFRLDKMTFDPQGKPVESPITYADAGSFKVVHSWEMGGPMGMKFAVRFSDLTVNGKPVKLPEASGAATSGPKPGDAKPGDPKAGGNAAGAKGKDEDGEKDEKDEDDEKDEGMGKK